MDDLMVDGVRWLLGPEAVPDFVRAIQLSVRAFIMFLAALFVVRMGHKRYFGRYAPFDVIVGIIIGSLFSRSINGKAPLLETGVAGVVLVVLHWLLSFLAFRSHFIGRLIKGNEKILVEDGNIQWKIMKKELITEGDLNEALRANGMTTDLENVRLAFLERNGDISIVQARKEPRVFEIAVEEGAQTVRVVLE